MKKTKLICAIIAYILLISCSGDEATTSNTNDTSLELLKTVKYTPTKDAYDNNVEGSKKNIQHFEDGKVMADTTFDINGNIAHRVIHTYTANSHTIEHIDNGIFFRKHIYVYDGLGRISETRSFTYMGGNTLSPGVYSKLVYETGIITKNHYDPDTDEFMPQYTYTLSLNSSGLIENWIDNSNGMVYDNDKPLQMNDAITANFEYYNVIMPVNMTKSVTELNNLFFESYDYRIGLAENNNYHLKKYTFPNLPPELQLVTFDKTFNEQGYVTYSKAVGTAYQNVRDSETFYYYE